MSKKPVVIVGGGLAQQMTKISPFWFPRIST